MNRCQTDDHLVECVACLFRHPHKPDGGEPECYRPVPWEPPSAVCGMCKWRVRGECGKTGNPAPPEMWAGCPMMEVR